MGVTHERNTDSRARNNDDYRIDYELFDSLMNAQNLCTHMARVRKIKASRSTYYRVINHEVGVTLRVAMQFAAAAKTSVKKLFPPQSNGNPTEPPPSGPETPPPPSGPKKGA